MYIFCIHGSWSTQEVLNLEIWQVCGLSILSSQPLQARGFSPMMAPFYVFPCEHSFHAQCLLKHIVKHKDRNEVSVEYDLLWHEHFFCILVKQVSLQLICNFCEGWPNNRFTKQACCISCFWDNSHYRSCINNGRWKPIIRCCRLVSGGSGIYRVFDKVFTKLIY